MIKTFKKYSLFTKILRFTNWLILTIFGISVIDNFGLDFFRNFFMELRITLAAIITYFSNTHFYSFIASLFKSKEEVTKPKISIREEPMSWESSRNESEIKQSKGNSKISLAEWLKPEPEIKPEESNNTKYLIIAGILIGCLAAYYWSDITPIIKNLFDKIKPKKDGDPGNNPIQPSFDNSRPSVEQRLQNIFDDKSEFKSDVSQIELIDNTQNIASTSKIDSSPSSDNSMNHYFSKPNNPIESQLTGLRPITGQDFTGESSALVQEIDTFLNYYDNASFSKAVIAAGFYKVIRERLQTLSELRGNSYEHLIQDDDRKIFRIRKSILYST